LLSCPLPPDDWDGGGRKTGSGEEIQGCGVGTEEGGTKREVKE
jgi:hypothetical protein